jgi:hypothetical protein
VPNYNYVCSNEECGHEFDEVVKYGEHEADRPCAECGSAAKYRLSAPMVLKASWPDGHRKKNDPLYQAAKQTAKLKVQRAGAKEADKAKIDAEIAAANGKTYKKEKRASQLFDK